MDRMNDPQAWPNQLKQIAADIGATEMAVFTVSPSAAAPVLEVALHIRPDNPSDETREAAVLAFKELIGPCLKRNQGGVVALSTEDPPQLRQYCVVKLIRLSGEVIGAAAFIVRRKTSTDAVETFKQLDA